MNSANIVFIFSGLFLGIIVSIPATMLFLRKQFDSNQDNVKSELHEVKAKLDVALQNVTRENEARLKENGVLKQERQIAENRLRDTETTIGKYIADTSESQTKYKATYEQLVNVRQERDSSILEYKNLQEKMNVLVRENQDIKSIGEHANKRIAEIEKQKEFAINEKQGNFDSRLLDQRNSFESITKNQKENHVTEIQSLKLSHENEILLIKKQMEDQKIGYGNSIAMMKESYEKMEDELREKHSDDLSRQQVMIDELKTFLLKTDDVLKATFEDASTKALKNATKNFLELAQNRFKEDQENNKAQSLSSKKEIENLLEPIRKELDDLEKLNHEINEKQAASFGALNTTIQNLNQTNEALANALKKPSVRGSWGEGQLISTLESSGWERGKNFDVQDTTEEDGKTLRTDVIVHLPRGRKIIIDSKVPLNRYLEAMEAESDIEKERCFKEHARTVRNHAKDLQSKEYWKRYDGSPPYVIMFLPYEGAYQMACEHDRSLLDDMHRQRIIIANPMTLMNLVHLATYVLNEERLQQNAEEVRRHGKELVTI